MKTFFTKKDRWFHIHTCTRGLFGRAKNFEKGADSSRGRGHSLHLGSLLNWGWALKSPPPQVWKKFFFMGGGGSWEPPPPPERHQEIFQALKTLTPPTPRKGAGWTPTTPNFDPPSKVWKIWEVSDVKGGQAQKCQSFGR